MNYMSKCFVMKKENNFEISCTSNQTFCHSLAGPIIARSLRI